MSRAQSFPVYLQLAVHAHGCNSDALFVLTHPARYRRPRHRGFKVSLALLSGAGAGVPWSVPSFWACPVCSVQHCCVRTLVSDTNHREYCWLSCPNGTPGTYYSLATITCHPCTCVQPHCGLIACLALCVMSCILFHVGTCVSAPPGQHLFRRR